jgi:hypothetical protein
MPYTSALPDTLIVGSTDLQSLDGIMLGDLSGLFAPGTRRGSNDVIPGLRGHVGAEKVYDAYAFAIPVTILPQNSSGVVPSTYAARRALMITNLRALSALLAGTNGLVSLTRRLSKTGGGYDTHTANGEFIAHNGFSLLNETTGRTELQFVNLSGAWFDAGAPTVPIVP